MKSTCAVNLHNVITVQQEGLGRRLATLTDERMHEVCIALGFALGCDPLVSNQSRE
jgi:mRNA-degrading endonuclease toxin of MazEF toxin-antitoxin module